MSVVALQRESPILSSSYSDNADILCNFKRGMCTGGVRFTMYAKFRYWFSLADSTEIGGMGLGTAGASHARFYGHRSVDIPPMEMI